MKALQVSHHYAPCIGGIEKYIQDMCSALKKNNVETEVLCLDRCPDSIEMLKEEETIKGIRVRRVPFLDAKYYKIAPSLLGEVRKSDADLLHVHQVGFLTDYLCLTKPIHKKPIVVSTHGGIFHTKNISGLKKIYFNAWCRRVLKAADFLIADSRHDLELFKKTTSRIKVIENGIDFERFSSLKRRRKKGQIMAIGRIARNKRIDNLLNAVEEAQNLGAKPRIIVAGSDPEKKGKEMKKIAQEKGIDAVFLLDAGQGELEKSMAESTFFASASEYEGFGIAAVEAMASGLVPILNSIETYSTFVRKKGTGFLTDFSKPKEAGKAIAKALSMRPLEIRKCSRGAQETAGKYDWREKAKEVKEIYRGVVG